MVFIKVLHHGNSSWEKEMFITPKHMPLVYGFGILNTEM